jgi:DNA-binding SARP family transcriptional activator/tetratricopeptide (TPR) repeat protein
VIYGLLGDLEVHRDGKLVELPGGPTLMLLAGLLINANRRMSKADLMRVAWGGGDVKEAQLHKRVMAVRETLAEIGRRDDIKTHARFGYELRVAEDDVDSLLFQRHTREADEAAAAGDTNGEVDCLRRALGLWRGPRALSNAYSDALRQDILALEQRHKRAAVRLFSLELDRGNPEEILDEVARVTALYPTDRRLCEQLMSARHQCGHLVDAAAAYERYREAVDAETGAPPDPLLRALHFAIAGGDERAIASAESALTGRARTPSRRPAAVPRQLPPPAELVGRSLVVDEATRLLRGAPGPAVPLIVISGPGGVGKTAAAVLASHQSMSHFPDGQLFMELHGSSGNAADTSEVLAQFLRALDAPQVPDTKAERLASFRTVLAERRVLIVLDDAADGAQVADLVPGNPRCAVLVTAQRRFPELPGARHLPALAPLDLPDATALFLHMVASSGISHEGDLGAVERVVTLCGGLPLALRIASALRVHDHPRPTAELANRLERIGPEALEYGELSIARTIGAGLERLDVRARRLFLGLGQLRLTRFASWTAAAVLDDGADAAAALSRLAASFMIDPVADAVRYRFHDLTRDYVQRRAQAEDPAGQAAIPGRAYRALLTLARHAHARLYGGDFEVVHSAVPDWDAPPEAVAEVDASPLAWFEKERLNIRAAVEHCAELGLTEICWDLAVSAHEFYTIRGYFDDWDATHQVALRACQAVGDQRGEGIVLACLHQPTLVASRRQAGPHSLADLWRAAGLLADCGDRHGLAIALRTLANALRRQGHLTRSAQLLAEALGHYTASGDTVGRWQTLRYIGQINLDRGDPAAAREALEAAEVIAAALGDTRLIAQTRYWVGQACLAAGDIPGARAAFDAVSDVYFDDMGTGRAYALHGLGCLAVRERAYGAAERHLNAAAAQAREAGDEVLEGRVWLSLAELRDAQGRIRVRAGALEHARAAFAGCGSAYLEVRALAGIAAAAEAAGDTAACDDIWNRIEDRYAAAGVPGRDRVSRHPAG